MNLAIIQAKKLGFFCRHFDPKFLYLALLGLMMIFRSENLFEVQFRTFELVLTDKIWFSDQSSLSKEGALIRGRAAIRKHTVYYMV